VDLELFKLANITSPAGSDLSLAKNLIITFNRSDDVRKQYSRAFNTIDLQNLFTRCEAMFPALQSITVHTDRATKPSTSLFDIGQACHELPAIITSVNFSSVGCFIATTQPGRATLTVKYKELAKLWQEATERPLERPVWTSNYFRLTDETLASRVGRIYFAKRTYEVFSHATIDILANDFSSRVSENYPAFKARGIDDHEYWTDEVCRYDGYFDD
jgi:hypothetical protein